MAPLVVFEGVGPTVLSPHGPGDLVRAGKEGGVEDDLPARLDIEEDRLVEVQDVAGLPIHPAGLLLAGTCQGAGGLVAGLELVRR